jgi:WD40 repeat protein
MCLNQSVYTFRSGLSTKSNTAEIKKPLKDAQNIMCMLALPNGNRATGEANLIKIRNSTDFKVVKKIEAQSPVFTLTLLSGNIFAAGFNKGFKLFSISKGYKCIQTFKAHDNIITSIVLLQDVNLATGSRDRTIKLHNKSNIYKDFKTLKGQEGFINKLLVLINGSIASASAERLYEYGIPQMAISVTIS